MRRMTVVAGVLACAVTVGAGCRKDKAASSGNGSSRESQDRVAQSEGTLSVDQSAVLPVDVKAGVQSAYPGATVQNVEKKTYNDRLVRYDVHLTTKDGKKLKREFGADGKPAGAETKAE